MAQRAALPVPAVTITPGYSWRLDLDVRFDGERPTDWQEWIVRMLIWGDGFAGLKLTNASGIGVEPVSNLPDASGPISVPVIRLTQQQTLQLATVPNLKYVIDLKSPGGDAEDYFAGPMEKAFAPPPGLLS